MKYLVTFRRRDGVPMPPDAIAGMLEAQREWLEEKVEDGSFDCAYAHAQGAGEVGIVNADSGEELSEILAGAPVFTLAAIEVQPLADISTLRNHVRAIQRVAEKVA